MRIAVTGAGGFIGSALCAAAPREWSLLALGHLRSLDRLRRVFPESVTILHADIADEGALGECFAGTDVIYHLAAISGEDRCRSDPRTAALANLIGTRNVVRAARRANVRRVVFASSYWVYTVYTARPMPLREDDRLGTDSLYGAFKASAEEMLNQLEDAVCLRFSNVYGFGTGVGDQWDGLVGRFVRAGLAGKPLLVFGGGDQGLELLHVNDAVKALIGCARPTVLPHRAYNVGAGRAVRVREVAEIVASAIHSLTGRKPAIEKVPAPPEKLWPDRWLDIERAQRDLKFQPTVRLEEGVREMVGRGVELFAVASV